MSNTVIEFNNVGKQYILGTIILLHGIIILNRV